MAKGCQQEGSDECVPNQWVPLAGSKCGDNKVGLIQANKKIISHAAYTIESLYYNLITRVDFFQYCNSKNACVSE